MYKDNSALTFHLDRGIHVHQTEVITTMSHLPQADSTKMVARHMCRAMCRATCVAMLISNSTDVYVRIKVYRHISTIFFYQF